MESSSSLADPAVEAAIDAFAAYAASLVGPAAHGYAVTPDNDDDLPYVTRGLYVGTGGDVTVDFVGGESGVTIPDVPSGKMLPIRVTKVYDTGTGASGIVAFW